MIERNIGCLLTCDFDDVPNAAGGQEVIFFTIGISSRNSRWRCFALFINAQIGQTMKTRNFYRVRKCIVHKGKSQEID